MSDIKKKISNESGSALILVLLLVVVFGIIGSSLIYVSLIHHENTIKREMKLQSYYAAETGVAVGMKKIQEQRLTLNTGDNDLLTSDIKLDSNLTINNIKVNTTNYEDFELIAIGESERSTELKETTSLHVKIGKQKPFNELMKDNSKIFKYSLANFGYPPSYSWFFFWPIRDTTSSTDNLVMGQELGYLPDYKFNLLFVNFIKKDLNIISNDMTIVGDIFSDQEMHLYYEDRYFEDLKEDTFRTEYNTTPSDKGYKYGSLPKFINTDLTLTNSDYLKFIGQNVYEEQNNGWFGTDYDYKREFYYEPSTYLSDLSIYGKNVEKKVVSGGNIPSLTNLISSNYFKNSPYYSGSWDLRITQDDDGDLTAEKVTFNRSCFIMFCSNNVSRDTISKQDLMDIFDYDIVHIPGSLIIDEGVNMDEFGDLVIVADDGIIIGAKPDTNPSVDEPVKINSKNVLLVALAKKQINSYWKDYTPIRNEEDTWLIYTDIDTNSYHNEYFEDERWKYISILANSLTEVNGWLVGNGDIIFDYKVSHDKLLGNPASPTVKISGGVIGRKIVFPENIEIAKELYIYEWNVQ